MKTTGVKIAMTIIFLIGVAFAPPATAQSKNKKEVRAENEQLKKQLADSKKVIDKMTKEIKESTKKIADLEVKLTTTQQSTPATTVTDPSQQQSTPANLNSDPVTISFTMADLMRNPDSIASRITTLAKSKNELDQAQQRHNDAIAGKVPTAPSKPAKPVLTKNNINIDYSKKKVFCTRSRWDSDSTTVKSIVESLGSDWTPDHTGPK